MSLFLLRDALQVGDMLKWAMAAPAAMAMLATPVWVMVGRKIGKRPAYFIALAIAPLYYLPMLFVPSGEIALIMSLLIIIGLGDAANQLFPNAMVPDTVEVDQLRTGERREGAIFGAWAFCRKFGMTAGAFIASLLLSAIGFVKGPNVEQTDAVLQGLRQVYVIIPAGLWMCALITLLGYKLTESRFREIKASIGASNADKI
ncbi:MAG: MFS transporter [Henriciella sp.]|nr:MFS transporter [Henriciella sp.]